MVIREFLPWHGRGDVNVSRGMWTWSIWLERQTDFKSQSCPSHSEISLESGEDVKNQSREGWLHIDKSFITERAPQKPNNDLTLSVKIRFRMRVTGRHTAWSLRLTWCRAIQLFRWIKCRINLRVMDGCDTMHKASFVSSCTDLASEKPFTAHFPASMSQMSKFTQGQMKTLRRPSQKRPETLNTKPKSFQVRNNSWIQLCPWNLTAFLNGTEGWNTAVVCW